MSLQITYTCVCDICTAHGPATTKGEFQAKQVAKMRNWHFEQVHYCGISLDYCPECAKVMLECDRCRKRVYNNSSKKCMLCDC